MLPIIGCSFGGNDTCYLFDTGCSFGGNDTCYLFLIQVAH